MKLLVLIIFIILFIIVFIYRYYLNNEITLISNIREGCCQLTYSSNKIPLAPINGGLEFTFSFWLYLSSWEYKYNQEKIILFWKGKNIKDDIFVIDGILGKCLEREKKKIKKYRKSITGKYGGLKISLSETDNNLIVSYSLLNGLTETLTIKNIPLQKWINITVLLRLRNLDIFLNGSLYKTKYLKDVPLYGKHKLIVNGGGGYDGYISKLKYYNQAITFPKIKEIFHKGH